MARLRGGGDAELLDQVDPAALRAVGDVAVAPDQGLEVWSHGSQRYS